MKKDKSRFKIGSWVKRFDGTIGMTVISILNEEQGRPEENQIKCKFNDPEGKEREATFPEKELVEI